MPRIAFRTTLAAALIATLAAGPALAALPPGLAEPQQPPAAAPQAPPAPAQPAPERQPAAPLPPGGEMVFDPDFQVQNRSRLSIVALHVTASHVDRRGPNLLGRARIDPNQSFPVRPARNAGCEYDVRVVYEGGRSEDRMAQNVCAINEMVFTGPQTTGEAAPAPAGQPGQVRVVDALREAPQEEERPQQGRRTATAPPQQPQPPQQQPRPQPPQQQPQPSQPPQQQPPQQVQQTAPRRTATTNNRPDIWVVNRSSTDIVGIQSSPVSDPNWGANRLTGTVPAGQRHALMLPGNLGCEWDIRVTYRGGQTEERRNVNFCEIEQLEFAGSPRRTEQR